MIKDNFLYNQNVKPNREKIEKLRTNFPEYFDGNGEFLLNQFKEMLKEEDIEFNKEGYELKFLGKTYARYLSSTKTETFIAPHNKHNEKDENKSSDNLYIIGDNLDALKHLLGSYAGKIKCIYIDPPYNTGSDGFVYPDNFKFNAKELSTAIGIEEEEAQRIINLAGKSSHSAWLTFMYPRLILARELLSNDGVIFISIDDNEQANLKLMCDEVFGEENIIANFIWNNKYTVSNDTDISYQHETITCYSKSRNIFELNLLPRTEKQNKDYKNRDNDPKGPWKSTPLHARSGTESGLYEVTFDNGITWKAPIGRFPRYSKDKLLELYNNGELYFNKNGGVDKKTYLSEVRKGITCGSLWSYDDVGHSHGNNEELANLIGKGIFNDPKGTLLLNRILMIATLKNSIVLDFFSGSATTAHAVMQLNAEDGGNRKYIMVQLPEIIKEDKPAYKAGYRTIDEIGRERIARAAKKIKEETNADIDYGFKLYSLENVTVDTLVTLDYFNNNPKLELDNLVSVFDTVHSKGKDAILSTWLAQDGYGLTVHTKKYKLKTYEADKIGDSLYLISKEIKSEDIMELIKRIEKMELDITRVVVYASSMHFSELHELKKNLNNLKNNKNVELIERY